jgi:hypothetical protein
VDFSRDEVLEFPLRQETLQASYSDCPASSVPQ